VRIKKRRATWGIASPVGAPFRRTLRALGDNISAESLAESGKTGASVATSSPASQTRGPNEVGWATTKAVQVARSTL
jgi:hypothetical protein